MSDPNHMWNDGDPITSELQICGCHITADIFVLCQRGRDLKKAADSWYNLQEREKDSAVDPAIKRTFTGNFQLHKRCYLKHLATGADWVL